jgi:hypothetical protein
MSDEPTLSKHLDDPNCDHKPMTWDRFLLLRAWARYVAWHENCTVALVGSVLEKDVPRDIDVALIWPAEKFREMFGTTSWYEYGGPYLWRSQAYKDKKASLWISGQELVKFDTRIDVRLCPDTWWPEKDRLILATPSEVEPPSSWNGVEFIVHKIVCDGEEETQISE